MRILLVSSLKKLYTVMHQLIPAAPSSYILIGNRVRVKSLGLTPGLANAPPPGLTRQANPPAVARGTWAQLELTDA